MGANHNTTRNMQAQKIRYRKQCAATNEACWICQQEIDYDANWDDYANQNRFELDHFYPVSTHPEHQEDPANFRASHAGCNRARSNKDPEPPLGRQSRQWY